VTVDLSDPAGAAALLAATDDLDIGLLVSNAGSARPGPLLDQPLDDLHRAQMSDGDDPDIEVMPRSGSVVLIGSWLWSRWSR
jgi:hypothetical protein